MAGVDKNYELPAKPKSSLFNRSLTMHTKPMEPSSKSYFNQPSLERGGSMKKTYNSNDSLVATSNSFKGKVRKLCNLFESSKPPSGSPNESPPQSLSGLKSTKSICSSHSSSRSSSSIRLPGSEDRIVVYFTSLRGIRRTYEDCYAVRMILRGFRVWVDERDVLMDSAYKRELQGVMGNEKHVSLPQVFIGGKYIGGVEVIRQLYETGELAKILCGYPKMAPGFVCDYCGDVRFMPCTNCSGSKKVFDEDEGELKRCLECNENGLIRCPHCCS